MTVDNLKLVLTQRSTSGKRRKRISTRKSGRARCAASIPGLKTKGKTTSAALQEATGAVQTTSEATNTGDRSLSACPQRSVRMDKGELELGVVEGQVSTLE